MNEPPPVAGRGGCVSSLRLAIDLFAAEHEAIAVRILEDRVCAPRLLLRLFLELDAALGQLAIGMMNIIAGERPVEERADAVFLAFGREQHHARLGTRDRELDPALAWPHRLIGRDLEAHLLRPEGKGAVLVRRWNADELQFPDHAMSSAAPNRSLAGAGGVWHQLLWQPAARSSLTGTSPTR